MSFNIKNTDSFQKGVLTTGGGGDGGGFSSPKLPNDATNNNEYAVENEDPLKYIVGGTDYIALGTSSDADTGGIAIGTSTDAGNGSIAIGREAKSTGVNGIAIGRDTTNTINNNVYSNSIVLNGTTSPLSATVDDGFFVKPIAPKQIQPIVLSYNYETGEITKGGENSSIRYKENLEPIQGYKDLLNIESYLFKYKDSDVTDAGLIAEHIDEYPSLRKLVYYKDYNETDEDGNDVTKTKPEGVHYQKLGVFNLKLIKDLYEKNKILKERLKNIKEKLQ